MSLGLPPQASTIAPKVDALFYAVTGVTTAVALAVFVTLIFFAIRYRSGSKTPRIEEVAAAQARIRKRVEVAWMAIPLLLFFAAFGWAGRLYLERSTAPANAMAVFVVAKQWMWKAQHGGGQREIDELHVPLNQPIRLVMTSQDVIHSFFVPAFRVKQDVLPGRYTELWFTPTKLGRFHLFCAEYCGTDHSRMGGDIVVLSPAEFEQWLSAHAGAPDMAAEGEALFRQYGCSGCHGANAAVHAPDLAGVYGKPVSLANGTTVVADDRYIRDSILLPQRDVVAGYASIMPSFAGQLRDEEIFALIAYIKSLGNAAEARK